MSARRAASLVPIMVITDDMASEKLLTASIMTATEPVAAPTAILKATRNTLAKMPMTLVRTMTLFRASAVKRGF